MAELQNPREANQKEINQVEIVARGIDVLIGVILPTEREQPGVSSLAVYGCMEAAARMIAACPADVREDALGKFVDYLQTASRALGTDRDARFAARGAVRHN